MPGVIISALGCYTPPGVLTNQDLEKLVDTSDEWILTRTGITQRHIAGPEMATGRRILKQPGIIFSGIKSKLSSAELFARLNGGDK